MKLDLCSGDGASSSWATYIAANHISCRLSTSHHGISTQKISIAFLGFKCLTLWIWELIFCNSPHTVHVHRFICMQVNPCTWTCSMSLRLGKSWYLCLNYIYHSKIQIVVLGNNFVTVVVWLYPSHANSKNAVLAMQIPSEITLQPVMHISKKL